ncbi:MAG: acyltransferase family protein [Candidatus Binatia bacterium]
MTVQRDLARQKGEAQRGDPAARGVDRSSAKEFFPGLESLRGLAILLVVLFHYKGQLLGDATLPASASWLWGPIYTGNSGVTLFFVLSGFLLSLPFLAEHLGGRATPLGRYAVSRVLRVVPLYYLAVLVAWMSLGNLPAVGRALLFLPTGFELFPYGVPWWSLSTEMQFYVLLPVCALLARHRAGRWLLLAGLVLWLACYANLYRQQHWMASPATLVWRDSLFGRAPNFLAGIVAAWIHLAGRDEKRPPTAWTRLGVPLLATLGLLALATWVARVGTNEADLQFPPWHAVEGAAWAAIVLAAARAARPPATRANLRAAVRSGVDTVFGHLGRISYALFLVHLPIQVHVLYSRVGAAADAPAGQALLLVTVSAVASWFLAVLCHRAVEEPTQQLKQKLFR